MQSATQLANAPVSKGALWTGCIVSGLIVVFLLMDAVMKLVMPKPVVEGMAKSGWDIKYSVPLGIILLSSVVVYVIPRTSVLGAILLTGYLGGAVATNMRLGNPLFLYTLFPVYFGVLIWGSLFLREPRLRELIPLKK